MIEGFVKAGLKRCERAHVCGMHAALQFVRFDAFLLRRVA